MKEGKIWKSNFGSILSKQGTSSLLAFNSSYTGKPIQFNDCLYNDLLPYELNSSPVSILMGEDNLWIATSMLSRIADTANNIVVMEKEFPVGIIGYKEIIKSILRNPTNDVFNHTTAKKIMNRVFYLDNRRVKLKTILQQMNKTDKIFSVIQNSQYDFSAVSIREILEIGSMCNSEIVASEEPSRRLIKISRDNSIKEVLDLLSKNEVEFVVLDNDSLILDARTILEKITTDLNFLEDEDNFLNLNASIFQFHTPKLIPEKISFSELCKVMLDMRYPYLATKNRIWTPIDVLDVLTKGIEK